MLSLRTLSSSLVILAACSSVQCKLIRDDRPESETTTTTDSGLEIKHTGGPAECRRPTQQGDTIAVNYRGTLLSDGTEFDSSYGRNRPFDFVLGIGRVIAGWDEGLEGMCIGESRVLTIPPHLAYGSSGMGPIPPESTLVFETRLEDILAVAPGSDPLPEEGVAGMPTSTPTASATGEGLLSIATAPSAPPSQDEGTPESATDEEKLETSNGEEMNADLESESVENEKLGDEATGEMDGVEIPVETQQEEGQAECKLLGPFALLVQGALGALALLSLVWKRWREEPKRPWKIFIFDVSKQVLGSFLTHIINLAMSMVGSVDVQNAVAHAVNSGGAAYQDAAGRTPNPCSYYLLNLGIDTTVGVPVLYILLKVLHALFLATPLARPPQSIKSGNYGSPAKFTWYLKQLFIYCIGLVGMKLFVLFLFMALPWLPWVGDWALRWTNGNEALEITFALFIFPLIMNAAQYWVIDSFIMDKKNEDRGYQQVAEDDDDEERRGILGDDDTVGAQNARGKSPDSDDNSYTASQSRGGSQPSRIDHSKLA